MINAKRRGDTTPTREYRMGKEPRWRVRQPEKKREKRKKHYIANKARINATRREKKPWITGRTMDRECRAVR